MCIFHTNFKFFVTNTFIFNVLISILLKLSKGPNYPYSSNVGPSSVVVNGNILVFGGTVAKNAAYELTVQGPDCVDNVLHEGCDLVWKNMGSMIGTRKGIERLIEIYYQMIIYNIE